MWSKLMGRASYYNQQEESSLKSMANWNIKMEYELAALSQQLKPMYEAWLMKSGNESLDEVRQEMMEQLDAVYEKSQQAIKGRRKRKKNKKEAEEQRGATQELTRIMESMLTHGEKYHNVRKNLTKLSDKIDSAETLYAILNPLVTKQLQAHVSQMVPGTHSKLQQIESAALLYSRMQQGMSNILQVFTFIMEANVESFECSGFAQKVVVYLLLHYPELIPTFVSWEKHVPKDHTQTTATMDVLNPVFRQFEERSSGKSQSSGKNCTTTEDRSDECLQDQPEHQQESIDQEQDGKTLQMIRGLTIKWQRLQPEFDDLWLKEFYDSLGRKPTRFS